MPGFEPIIQPATFFFLYFTVIHTQKGSFLPLSRDYSSYIVKQIFFLSLVLLNRLVHGPQQGGPVLVIYRAVAHASHAQRPSIRTTDDFKWNVMYIILASGNLVRLRLTWFPGSYEPPGLVSTTVLIRYAHKSLVLTTSRGGCKGGRSPPLTQGRRPWSARRAEY